MSGGLPPPGCFTQPLPNPCAPAYITPVNQLYYGDNLNVLRESIKDETVDLIYLDPPFNSKRDYNLLFKSPKGHESEAQIPACNC